MVRCRGLCVKAALIAGLLLGLGNSLATAQTGSLRGKVTDAKTGEALPQANVVVTAPDVSTGAAASMSGEYEVKALAAGTYTVSASYIGYDKLVVENVEVKADEAKELNLALEPSLVLLNPTVVSASRREEKALKAPAAISVLEATEIRQVVSPSSQAILANTIGVDMAKTGIDREEIVLRGFNNAFSGATYVLTDYRQAAVASLGVNLHSVMPNVAIDLERIEVVRGPGSALYGAGVDAGVIHYITKDPFRHPGTTVSIGGGERASTYASFRQAGVLNDKWGYKITGQYAKADDWELDSTDPEDKKQMVEDAKGSQQVPRDLRSNDYLKYNLNGYLQYRMSDRTSLSGSAGYSSLDATVLSGIGTVQADGFGYTYGQLRLQSGNFFAQTYLNRNKGGDSFIYGTDSTIVDNSTLFNTQAQYDFSLSGGKHKVIAGADFDLTTPDTKGTIYGRNENADQISEVGAYVQSASALSNKFDLTLALRGDYNNIQEELQLSPRVALVLKASTEHTFRATYNRAFSSPGNNSLFLDIPGRITSLGGPYRVILQGRGARDGYTFNNFRQNQTVEFFVPTPPPVALFVQSIPLSSYPVAPVYGLTYASIDRVFRGPEENIPDALRRLSSTQRQGLLGLLGTVAQRTSPLQTTTAILGIPDNSALGYRQVAGPVDIEPLKQTTSNTIEIGYKGIFNNRVLFAVDAYYVSKKNFVGPLLVESPLAYLPTQFIAGGVTTIIQNGLQTNDPVIIGSLQALVGYDPTKPPTDPGNQARLAQAITTLSGIFGQTASGIVQPDQPILAQDDPNAVAGFLTYRNFGDVQYYGIDASVQVAVSNRLNVFGNVSLVSDDFFDNKELDEANVDLQLALNAPKFKGKFGFSYNVPKGFGFNAAGRYSDGFPVRSGPYVGDVEDYFLLDVGAGYDLSKWAPGMTFDVMVQNVLDKEHREFIGAPKLGRLGLARLNYSF